MSETMPNTVQVHGVRVPVPAPEVLDDYRFLELFAGEDGSELHLPALVKAVLGDKKDAVLAKIAEKNGGRAPLKEVAEAVAKVAGTLNPN